MKRIFAGIDISKGWLDFIPMNDQVEILDKAKRVNNDIKGVNEMIQSLTKRYNQDDLWFCFEHTGNYGLLLSSILQSSELTYSAVPALEIKKSLGITRGKSDQVDARRIAEYAAIQKHKVKPSKLPSDELMKVKNLLTFRAQLIKTRTAFINSIKSYREAEKVVDLSYITSNIEDKINLLDQDIKSVEREISITIKQSEELKNNYQLISSVRGIGQVIGAFLLVYTNNFTSFDNPRKFNCFTGLAPFESSSGITKGKTKTSVYRHKALKVLLFNGANSAIQHDPQLKRYYQRKKQEGKEHMTIINAIACKIIYRAFATINRQSPYVILAQ